MLRRFFEGRRDDRSEIRVGADAPGRSTRRRAIPALESLEGRQLMTLTPISPGAGYPYTTGVELQITFPDHKSFVGSGVLVDSYHVLTAGHVVYSYADGGFATSILATPEYNGSGGRFGSASMTHETTYNTFIAYSKAHPGQTAPGDMDIALFSLNKNIGTSTGSLSYGYNNNNNQFSSGTIFNTFGYPAAGGYSGNQEELSSGAIAGLSSDGSAIEYYQSQITTYGGQSGSPVYLYNASTGARIVYGIHVGGSGTANSENFATRITQSIFSDIGSWISQDNAVRHPGAVVAGTPDASTSYASAPSPVTAPVTAQSITSPSTLASLVPLTTTPGDVPVTFGMTVPTHKLAEPFRYR